jgi:hypothetical protein
LTDDDSRPVERCGRRAVEAITERNRVADSATERLIVWSSQQSVPRQTVRRIFRHQEIVSQSLATGRVPVGWIVQLGFEFSRMHRQDRCYVSCACVPRPHGVIVTVRCAREVHKLIRWRRLDSLEDFIRCFVAVNRIRVCSEVDEARHGRPDLKMSSGRDGSNQSRVS